MGRSYVEVEVCITEFDDDALIDEVRARGLEAQVIVKDEGAKPVDVKQLVGDIQGYLCTKRYDKAYQRMETLMEALLPIELVKANRFMDAQCFSAAVCELDRFLEPSPAAKATQLPSGPKT
jgi:hypothetical protein